MTKKKTAKRVAKRAPKRTAAKRTAAKRAPRGVTFTAWVAKNGACAMGIEYLRGRETDADMWRNANIAHRDWVRDQLATVGVLRVPRGRCCEFCHGALCDTLDDEWRDLIAPALRREGVLVARARKAAAVAA